MQCLVLCSADTVIGDDIPSVNLRYVLSIVKQTLLKSSSPADQLNCSTWPKLCTCEMQDSIGLLQQQ